jgi:hypothetical protein
VRHDETLIRNAGRACHTVDPNQIFHHGDTRPAERP